MEKSGISLDEYTKEQLLTLVRNAKEPSNKLPTAGIQLFVTAMREVNLPSRTVKEILMFVLENE